MKDWVSMIFGNQLHVCLHVFLNFYIHKYELVSTRSEGYQKVFKLHMSLALKFPLLKLQACVGPVLQVIQGLWRTKSLQPVAFKLFHSLWKVENRCYPYLEKALLEEASGSSLTAGISEFLLSKVIVIRDICLTEYDILASFCFAFFGF